MSWKTDFPEAAASSFAHFERFSMFPLRWQAAKTAMKGALACGQPPVLTAAWEGANNFRSAATSEPCCYWSTQPRTGAGEKMNAEYLIIICLLHVTASSTRCALRVELGRINNSINPSHFPLPVVTLMRRKINKSPNSKGRLWHKMHSFSCKNGPGCVSYPTCAEESRLHGEFAASSSRRPSLSKELL